VLRGSPPIRVTAEPGRAGERTGTFRKGGDVLLTGADGRSTISIPDFAIAVADEVEQRASIRQQITFAY
jgi:putative NADH-flavin reductase